jgi:hypothetical protein
MDHWPWNENTTPCSKCSIFVGQKEPVKNIPASIRAPLEMDGERQDLSFEEVLPYDAAEKNQLIFVSRIYRERTCSKCQSA